MNDGNTALPVSPVPAEDTMNLASMFSRAAEAIVNTSTMPSQIADLKAAVEALTAQVQSAQDHSRMLDQQLLDMRDQRNRAEDALAAARNEITTLTTNLDIANHNFASLEQRWSETQSALEQTKRDRDDYGLKAMQVEEDLTAARAALADIKERIGSLWAVPMPPVQPEPAPPIQPSPSPADDGPVYPGQVDPDPAPASGPPGYQW